MRFNNPDINILKDKKLFIFDMDGTIYLSDKVFENAVEFINSLRNNGKKVLFFTNNASHTDAFYIEKLYKLGFNPSAEEIMTSADVTIEYLNMNRKSKCVFLVGTDELNECFRQKGIRMVDASESSCDIVVTSFDTQLTYDKLYNACRFIHSGAEYFCTHPDLNCPIDNGYMPDSGSIAAFVTASTGVTPKYFGKPYEYALDIIKQITGFENKDMCMMGDRLYTDIVFGKKHGVTSILVLSGATKIEDLDGAIYNEIPDFVFDNIGCINLF